MVQKAVPKQLLATGPVWAAVVVALGASPVAGPAVGADLGLQRQAAEAVAKGDYDLALSNWNTAIRLNPTNFTAYVGRATVYVFKKEYSNALVDLSAAIALKPDSSEAYGIRGIVRDALGELDQALADESEAIRLHRD